MSSPDDARRKILERRAVFVAAALAATASASGCDDKPKVCLAAVADEYRDASWTPPGADAGGADEKSSDAEPPRPCLSIAMPTDAGTRPHVCLKVAMPRDAGPCLTY